MQQRIARSHRTRLTDTCDSKDKAETPIRQKCRGPARKAQLGASLGALWLVGTSRQWRLCCVRIAHLLMNIAASSIRGLSFPSFPFFGWRGGVGCCSIRELRWSIDGADGKADIVCANCLQAHHRSRKLHKPLQFESNFRLTVPTHVSFYRCAISG